MAICCGRLDGAGRPLAFRLFAIASTCSKDVFARSASRPASPSADRCAAVRFHRAWHSAGDFANYQFPSNIADLVAAADFCAPGTRTPKILIAIAWACGGPAGRGEIPNAPGRDPHAPFDPQHVEASLHRFARYDRAEAVAKVTLAGRSFTLRKDFVTI